MTVARDNLAAEWLPIAEASVASLAELFDARVQRTPMALASQWFDPASKQWRRLAWAELDARVQAYTQALATLDLEPGARVAIQLENGPDWVAAEQAIYRLGYVVVGIFAFDTAGSSAHILDDSGAQAIFLRDAATWTAIAAGAPLPQLKYALLQRGAAAGERTLALETLLSATDAGTARASSQLGTLASLVYTSGTTGKPRGAMLSHGALLANVFACHRALLLCPDDVMLSLLPLSHSFERVAGWHHAVLAGATTAYSRGAEHLAEDLQQIQPTALLAVPRVFERLYARLRRAVDDGPLHQRMLFNLAIAIAQNSAPRYSRRLTASVVVRVRASLGGRLRMAISGGAPLSPLVARRFAALGVPVLQGYGITEAGPVVSVNRPDDHDPDSAGRVLDNVETRIGPDGELQVRSPSLMTGYWHDEAASHLVLDAAGWLHTGDKVSRLCADRLYLTGRLKDVLVMSTGVKAAPSQIEARLTADPLFEQALVLGEGLPYLAALVVADANQLAILRADLGLPTGLQSTPSCRRLEQALLERCSQRLGDLSVAHQIRRIACVSPWTLANGLVTATLKPRRAAIGKAFLEEVQQLYEGHCSSHKTDCSSNADTRQ